MRNYFKVFRLRALLPEFEIGGHELPIEHFVFFEDGSLDETQRAASASMKHVAALEQKKMRAKVCVLRRVELYRTIEEVGEGL